MMRVLFVFLSICVAVTLQSCVARPRAIVVFHTNDIHGHFLPEPATWRKDNALVGGVTALSYHLDQLRQQHKESIYLDAGDLMTGNPICNVEYDAVPGGALLELLHRLQVSAMCLGNHEFDLGAEHLRDFITASPVSILCANLKEKDNGWPLASPYRVVEANGVRIGVIGLLLDDLRGVVAQSAAEPFLVEDAATTAQHFIDEVDPKTDLIILLTHMGVDADSVLATKLRRADVIVGGHSHTRLDEPKRVNGILIVQAGAYCKNLGVLELTVSSDTISSYRGHLVELLVPKTRVSSDVASLADSLEVVIHEQYGQVIGDLAEPWKNSYHTGSNGGNWICDRLRERSKADVAFVNAGGLRKDLLPGPITRLDIVELIPFMNSVVTFEATGADLLKVAYEQGRAHGLHAHGALEMSGMTVTFAKHGDRVEMARCLVHGEPVRASAVYRVVSIDYVAQSQADKYLGFQPRNLQPTGELLSDVVIDEIRKVPGPITSDPSPRIEEVP